jgi:SOS response regulatory protein OraA/RecX
VPNPPPTEPLKDALAFLSTRDRFSGEIRMHLVKRGYDPGDVESVVQFLGERKLINDENTTQSLIERHSGKRSVGIERLRAEFEKLGAPEEMIERSLASLSEADRALDALRAKFRTGADRAKAGRYLCGRGFTEEVVDSALDAFCGNLPE